MSGVVDVGDALELTFYGIAGLQVTATWLDPDQVAVLDAVPVEENPPGSTKYPKTFLADRAGIWTAEFRASGAVERYFVHARSVSGPPPLAAVGDVAEQYGPLTPTQEGLVAALLRAASNMVRARNATVDVLIAGGKLNGDLVALAVTNMVLRVLRNPSGLRAETVGPFSRTYDTSAAAGLLVFTPDEEALLTPTATAPTGVLGQFRPTASLAIQPIRRRGGWPDGWW